MKIEKLSFKLNNFKSYFKIVSQFLHKCSFKVVLGSYYNFNKNVF